MKIKTISYSRVFALPNFQNEKIGLEIELGRGENPLSALKKAKLFTQISHDPNTINNAKNVLANKEDKTLKEIEDANEILEVYNKICRTK
ncbi:MAG: hypothetical protein WHS65_10145 [Melioribacteraceae bacterium]